MQMSVIPRSRLDACCVDCLSLLLKSRLSVFQFFSDLIREGSCLTECKGLEEQQRATTRANDMLGSGCSFVCSVLAPCCAPEQWCCFIDSGWLWTKTLGTDLLGMRIESSHVFSKAF